MKKIYKLFSCCQIVKGASRSIICDLQRSNFCFIPNDLEFIIASNNGLLDLNEIKLNYADEDLIVIDEYLDFLLENEFVFLTNEPENFPDINLEWDSPYLISNAIVDIGSYNLPIDSIVKELDLLGCKHVQIRSYDCIMIGFVEEILSSFENTRIASVEIITKWHIELNIENLMRVIDKYPRAIIIIHSFPSECRVVNYEKLENHKLIFSNQKIHSSTHCGVISESFFSINIQTFTEAYNLNSCLNRKISIDCEGNIKNCPSMPKIYGNITNDKLQDALKHPDFKKNWLISKDLILTCKDCEFRYICTDCRAYLEDPEDIFSKPLKCGYNPYTCEWEEWSANPLKQKAIDYYGMRSILE